MHQPIRIAAVFATMNRASTAVACLRALADQTRPPDLVVVADNFSSDGTGRELDNLAALPFKLVIHRMGENRGNAGGVEEAMELAFSFDMDAVWILDDDSWPRPEALAFLSEDPWDPSVVRHALQVDPTTENFTWPMWVEENHRWKLIQNETGLPQKERFASRSSWTGALISRRVWERTGPVNGSLFIRGEDEEYPWRIAMAGFRFEAVRGAVLDHPGPETLVHWKFAGRNFFFEPRLTDWKLYYKIRNLVWLKRLQSGDPLAIATAVAYVLAAAGIDGPKRLRLVIQAAFDGWRGKLGKWEHHP